MALALEDLRMFRSVAAAGSFGRGAAQLRLSQPTVSERMARLERTVRKPLFVRTGRGVRLTAAGERLLPYAERCLAMAEEALAAARAEENRLRVRVALHASFAPGIVPLVLDALEPHDADVSCTDAHTEEVIQLLDDGAVDLGFVVPSPYPRTLTVEPFLTDPVICVAHPGHRLAGGRPVRVADLAQDAVACTAWGDGAARFLAMLRASSVPSARLHAVSPAETVARLARRGSHVGLLTRSTVTADLANGVLAELPVLDLPRWDISLALAYRTADAGTAVVRAVRATVLG